MLEKEHPSIDINQLPDPEDHKIRLHTRKKRGKLPKFLVIFLFLVFVVFSYQVLTTNDGTTFITDSSKGILDTLRGLLTREDKKLKGESDDRVNFLVLGMGGPGHDGPFLTDTIMVASYRPSDGKVALLSIPRDLAVYVPGYGYRKINSVNAIGEAQKQGSGGELTKIIVSELLGIDLSYYMRVDFNAFSQLVDDLNGIDIYIATSFTDTQYPADNYEYQTLSFQQGWQKMDGETALKYVRSRHGCCGEGGDFARAKRQQIFIEAIKEKILKEKIYLDPTQLIKSYNNYQTNVDSNLKVWEIVRMGKLIKKSSIHSTQQVVLTNGPDGELEDIIGADGAYMLQPKNGNYAYLQSVAQNIFTNTNYTQQQKPATTTVTPPRAEFTGNEQAKIAVLNGTFMNGLASSTSADLEERGYAVVLVGNAPTRDYEENLIYDVSGGKYPKTLTALTDILGAKKALELPEWLQYQLNSPDQDILTEQTEIVVVLGVEQSSQTTD